MMRLRELADGTRFTLKRTGEVFRRIGMDSKYQPCIFVVSERCWENGRLNHMCEVVPIVKPHIRPKSIRKQNAGCSSYAHIIRTSL